MTHRLPIDPEQVLAHDPCVRGLARRLLRDPHAAADVAQQAWTAACQQPAAPASLAAWLALVVRRLAGRRQRTERRELARQRAAAKPITVPSAAAIVQREAVRAEVVRAVLALAPQYRDVVLLRWFEQLPPRAIARQLGLPVETVRTRLKRALAELRLRLDAHAGGDRAAWGALLAPFARETGPLATASAALAEAATSFAPGVLLMSIPARLVAVGILLVGMVAIVFWLQRDPPVQPPASPLLPAAAVQAASGHEAPSGTAADVDAATAAPRQAAPVSTAATEGSLRVRVRYGDDAPAIAVPLEVRRAGVNDALQIVRATTDATGEAVLSGLSPGRHRVSAWRAAMESGQRVELVAGQETLVRIVLTGGVDATGIVVDGAGLPIAGAEVVVADWGGAEAHVLAHSSADGTFALRSIGAHCHVGARAAGKRPSSLRTITASEGAKVDGLRLVLSGSAALVAGVVLGPDERPVSDALVRIGSQDQDPHRLTDGGKAMAPRPVLLRTAADGRFAADNLPPGKLPVAVCATRLARWLEEVEVAEGARCDLIVRLQPGVTLRGTVRDHNDAPVAGADVFAGAWFDLGQQHHRTDATGTFLCEGLAVGELPVMVDHDKLGQVGTKLRARAGETLTWDPVLSAGLVVRGRVVDADGKPVAKVLLEARAENLQGGWFASEVTAADGRFTLKNCPPDTTIQIEARRHAMVEVTMRRVKPDGDEVVIQMPKAEFVRIKGTVLGPDGEPRGNVDLTVGRRDGGADMGQVSATGAFDAGPYPPGEWTVSLRTPGLAPILRTKQVAPNEVWDLGTLRFSPGGTIAVTLVGDVAAVEDRPIAVYTAVGEWLESIALEDGRAVGGPFAAGDYVLQLQGNRCAAQRLPVVVRQGVETKLDVPVTGGLLVELTFEVPAAVSTPRLPLAVSNAAGNLVLRSSVWCGEPKPVVGCRLTAGTYRVAIVDPEWQGEAVVEAAAPGPVRVTIPVQARN